MAGWILFFLLGLLGVHHDTEAFRSKTATMVVRENCAGGSGDPEKCRKCQVSTDCTQCLADSDCVWNTKKGTCAEDAEKNAKKRTEANLCKCSNRPL